MSVVESNERLAIRRSENQRVTYAMRTLGRYVSSPHRKFDNITFGSSIAGPVKREQQFQFKLILHCIYHIIIRYIKQPQVCSACASKDGSKSGRPHSIRRVETQSIRDVATGSMARLSHQAISSPEL
jgi:hypothetical protein